MAKKKEATTPTPSPEDEYYWIREPELPAAGSVYGGQVRFQDGRIANIYMFMGKAEIEILEVTVKDILLTPEELLEEVVMGDRKITLQRYIFEEIIP